MTEKKSRLVRAREAVAERYAQPYTKRAILRGEWDHGQLVQNEFARLCEEEGEPANVE